MNINPRHHQTPERISEELVWINKTKENPEHFSPLYKKYHGKIFTFVYQRMDDYDDARDVTSLIFIKVINNIHLYDFKGAPFSSWLYRIANNEVVNFYRENKKNRTVNLETTLLKEFVEDLDSEIEQKEIENELENEIEILKEAIQKLKLKHLEIIELRYFEKRSMKEISEILNITETNAKVKCFRALEKLKELYQQ